MFSKHFHTLGTGATQFPHSQKEQAGAPYPHHTGRIAAVTILFLTTEKYSLIRDIFCVLVKAFQDHTAWAGYPLCQKLQLELFEFGNACSH